MSAGRRTVLDLALLDGFRLEGTTAELPPGVQRLVAHVSLTRRPDRAVVAGILWPEVTESTAHANLRSTLWRLHRIVPGLVVSAGSRLRLSENVGVDVHRLRSWAQGVLERPEQRDPARPPAAAFSGDLLPGWCDAWVVVERERLRQMRLHALEAQARHLGALQRYGEALETALTAVEAGPLRESAHRVVVALHLAEGNAAEAVRHYREFRQLLADELGIAPSPSLDRLLHDAVPGAVLSRRRRR